MDGDIKTRSNITEKSPNNSWLLSVLIDEHDTHWSDENAVVETGHLIPELSNLFLLTFETFLSKKEDHQLLTVANDALLTAFQEIDAAAKKTQVTASMLALFGINNNMLLSSVGVSTAYLLRKSEMKQLSVDDITYITENGVTYQLSNILSNSVGLGSIKNESDIHLSSFITQPDDLIILCNKTFYEKVTTEEILDAEVSLTNLESLCCSLGKQAAERSNLFDTILLCLVRVGQT